MGLLTFRPSASRHPSYPPRCDHWPSQPRRRLGLPISSKSSSRRLVVSIYVSPQQQLTRLRICLSLSSQLWVKRIISLNNNNNLLLFDDTPSRPCKSWCPIGGMAWSEDIVSLGMKAKGAGSNIYSSSVESSLLLFPPLDIIMLARHPADNIISESESFSFFIDTPASERAGQRRTNINQSFRSHYRKYYFFVFTASISLSLWERMAGGCMGGCWRVAPPKKIWISYSETRYWNRFMVWISSIHHLMGPPGGYLCMVRGT